MIRNVQRKDASRIADIYNYYILNTVITFEEEIVTVDEIERRIEKIGQKHYPFIVYETDNKVVGYAYLDQWRYRSAYDITLETSIYVDINYQGKGTGLLLYDELIQQSKNLEIHSLIGVISLPNDASRSLHEKFGFQLVGNFKESGKKFDKLIDVEFWQLKIK